MSARNLFSTAIAGAALLMLAPANAATPGAARFVDPLDAPARLVPRALQAPVFALAQVDADRVVAVGPRGHILRSSDRGRSWTQQPVPVSTDLVAVRFPTPAVGWAVGHDGVALLSTDGGVSWTRVMDGRRLGAMMVTHYEKRLAAGDSSVSHALDESRRMAKDGPVRPFLSVFFRNDKEGWLVGQFNLIVHTVDGGASWQPWLDRVDNPDGYSLHAVKAVGDDIFIVGELGLVLRLDAGAQRFRRIKTPYAGSWFGGAASRDTLVATGLRGSAWRSGDAGASWQALQTGTAAAINGGIFLDERSLVLITQRGDLLLSTNRGDSFAALPKPPGLASAFDVVSMEPGWLLVGGPSGVQRVALPAGAN
jgi:photosystem II stability/assembly factor-like uncharacterized protein